MERTLDSLITELEQITSITTALSALYLDDSPMCPNKDSTRMILDSVTNHITRIVEDLDKLDNSEK